MHSQRQRHSAECAGTSLHACRAVASVPSVVMAGAAQKWAMAFVVMTPLHPIQPAIDEAVRALGEPIDLRPFERHGELIGAVGRWRHGDATYERPALSCFQLIMNVSGGHLVNQMAPEGSWSARIREGSVGMLAPDRASTVRVKGKADVVVMFLEPKLVAGHEPSDQAPATDCFELSLLDFHAALTRAMVAFGLSRRLAADALAIAATEAVRGIALHRSLAGRRRCRGGLAPQILRSVDAAVQDWLEGADGPPPGLPALASVAGLSPTHFLRSFRVETGTTPGKAVQARRLRQALSLLLGSNLPVSEIGERLGYSSPSHFVDTFKRAIGATPGTVRCSARSSGPTQVE